MPANFVLTLTAPKEYGVEGFNTDNQIWSATDASKTTVIRYTGDPIRDSVMRIESKVWTLGDSKLLGDGLRLGDSISGMGEGAYKDFSVFPEIEYSFSCFYKVYTGILNIKLFDLTNGGIISSMDKTEAKWKSYESSFTIPSGCNTIRVAFLQSDLNKGSGPFFIDDVSVNGNAIMYDPDNYSRVPERIGSLHQTLSGRRIYDLRAIHYSFYLGWNYLGEDQYENLRKLYYSNELLYFNDGNVPPLIERETVYEMAKYNYQNITNPSITHKAYYASSYSLPSGKSDFESWEFTTEEYEAISSNDSNYKDIANPSEGEYLYQKFLLRSSINTENVKRFRVNLVMSGDDFSPQDMDGGVLYAWDGMNWVELTKSTNSAKVELTYSTAEIEVSRQFVDSEDDYIRLLLRSRNRRVGTNNINLKVYYVECEINEGLDLKIDLSHKAILNENGDVIWVRNITQVRGLELGDDYSISNDRRVVEVFNQSSGDEIEVKYNRYFEVMFSSIPEEWLSGNLVDEGENRVTEIVLQTLSESK